MILFFSHDVLQGNLVIFPRPQNHLFWDLSLFLKFRLKSPNLVQIFGPGNACFTGFKERRKRFRLILQTRDF